MAWKVMPSRSLLDRHGFEVRIKPNQRPKVFRVNLIESLQPLSHALRLAALKTLRQAIEQIVICVEMSLRMRARVLLPFAGAGQWSFEDIAKIKDVVATRQHGVCDVLMHQTEPGAIVKVFAGGMCVRVEVVDQPGGREDPVFKAFVVITILGTRCQHPLANSA